MSRVLNQYAFINAKLRARISKALPDVFFETLGKTRTLPETIQALSKTDYAPVTELYNRTGDIKFCELALKEREVEVYTGIERHLAGGQLELAQALASRFDAELLKETLRLWRRRVVNGDSIDDRLVYISRRGIGGVDIDSILSAENAGKLAAAIDRTPYSGCVAAGIDERRGDALFKTEVAIDRKFYDALFNAIDKLVKRDREIARRLAGIEVDIQNVNWIIRFKEFYRLEPDEAVKFCLPNGWFINHATLSAACHGRDPGEMLDAIMKGFSVPTSFSDIRGKGATERFSMIERLLRHIVGAEVRRILAGDPFTIGIMLAYFLIKSEEVSRIITIINAKFYEIPEERIAALL